MPALAWTTSIPPSRSTVAVDGGLDRRLVGDVADGPGVRGTELGGERLEPLRLEPDERDARTAGGGDARGLRADAAGGAGDEDDLAGEGGSACHGASQAHAGGMSPSHRERGPAR